MPYFILILKTTVVVILAIIVRGTLPRYRFDQATALNWKHFLFIWLSFIVVNMTWLIIFY
jgi:NADH:ubiquinone oxidoreductase subunit H